MDIRTKLYDLASQENCDGEPYDTMQEAADYITQLEQDFNAVTEDNREMSMRQSELLTELAEVKEYIERLEQERDELRAHNDYLLNECHVFTDAALAEIKAQAVEDAADNCELITGRSALREYANKLRESV